MARAKMNLRNGPSGKPPAVDTGELLNSIDCRVEPESGRVVIGTPLIYGAYLEMGTGIFATGPSEAKKIPWRWFSPRPKWRGWHTTKGMEARPWLQPALDESKDDILNLCGEAGKELTINFIKNNINKK